VRINRISLRVAQLVLYTTKRYTLKTVQAYAPITRYSEDDIHSFYNVMDDVLWKPNHYAIVMGDFNAQVWKLTNPMETATGKFGLEMIKIGSETLVEWATPRVQIVMIHEYRVSEEIRQETNVEKPKWSDTEWNTLRTPWNSYRSDSHH